MDGEDEDTNRDTIRTLDANIAEVKLSRRKIMDVIGIRGQDKGTIGAKEIRKKKFNELGSNKRNVLVSVFRSCLLKTAQSFLPLEHTTLMDEGLKDLVPDKSGGSIGTMFTVLRKGHERETDCTRYSDRIRRRKRSEEDNHT